MTLTRSCQQMRVSWSILHSFQTPLLLAHLSLVEIVSEKRYAERQGAFELS